MYGPFQAESDSISSNEEEDEEPPPAAPEVAPGVPTLEETAQHGMAWLIQRQRTRNEDAQELRAYRANSDKLAQLRAKDLENWLKVKVEARNVKERAQAQAQAEKIKAAKVQATQNQGNNLDPQPPSPKPKKPRWRRTRFMSAP